MKVKIHEDAQIRKELKDHYIIISVPSDRIKFRARTILSVTSCQPRGQAGDCVMRIIKSDHEARSTLPREYEAISSEMITRDDNGA